MRGWFASQAEILRRRDYPLAKQVLPNAVDHDAGQQRARAGIRRGQPAGERSAAAAGTVDCAVADHSRVGRIAKDTEEARLHSRARPVAFAAFPEALRARRTHVIERLQLTV